MPCPHPAPNPMHHPHPPQAASALGLAAAAALLRQASSGRPPSAVNFIGGAAVGCAAGLLAHLATRPAEMAAPDRMAAELKG